MGIDQDIFTPTANTEDVVCPICQDVLEAPRRLSGCTHHFCLNCIERWLQDHDTCPSCRHEGGAVVAPDYAIVQHIQQLPLPCPHDNLGCTDIICFDIYQAHVDGCGFRPTTCARQCGEVVLLKDVGWHALVCTNRYDSTLARLMCHFCRVEYTHGGQPTHCDYVQLADSLRAWGYL